MTAALACALVTVPAFNVTSVHVFVNGVGLDFSAPIMAGMGDDPGDYTVVTGTPETSQFPVSVTVSRDRKSVFLETKSAPVGGHRTVRINPGLSSRADEPIGASEVSFDTAPAPKGRHAVHPATRPLNGLTRQEKAEGFALLFDGRTFASFRGWRRKDMPATWKAVDGEMRVGPGRDGGDIVTKDTYADFDLRLEWNVSPGANSGVFFRADESLESVWHSAPEMQILDDALAGDGKRPETSAGSNYDMQGCKRKVVRPAGAWNETRIVVKGNDVTHWLNGYPVVHYVLGSKEWLAQKARSKFAAMESYCAAPSGGIALQDHGYAVAFRNLRVKRL